MEYRTCTYIRDDGNICNSAAVTNRNLCLYHLRPRARLMRMAQHRARNQRFDLQLPPLESMHAVQSALTQLSEALAADMIDLKRADRLIRVLNIASRNLLKADKWPASPYHSAETSSTGAPREGSIKGDVKRKHFFLRRRRGTSLTSSPFRRPECRRFAVLRSFHFRPTTSFAS